MWKIKPLMKIKERLSELKDIMENSPPPFSLEQLVQELSEKNIIKDESAEGLVSFSKKYNLDEILKNTAITTGIITLVNSFLPTLFIPNIPAAIYLYYKSRQNELKGEKFMQDYNFNALGVILTLGAGSIGYLQQIYLRAESIDVMKLISYASVSYIIESLRPLGKIKGLSLVTKGLGLITKAAGIDTIEDYDRLRYAKKVFRYNGESLNSLMYLAEFAYRPYLYLGKIYRSFNSGASL